MKELVLLKNRDTLALIDNDPLLVKKVYEIDGEEIVIANASKKLFTPTEPHQLLAKGIVYKRNKDGGYTLISLPLVKIYNHFEAAGKRVIDEYKDRRYRIIRKYDGTLVSRWVYEGKVYFSTRGEIISLSGGKYMHELSPLLTEDIIKPELHKDSTLIYELVGIKGNNIESYATKRIVHIGTYSKSLNSYIPVFDEEFTFSYTLPSPFKEEKVKDVVAYQEKILGFYEGVIVEFLDPLTGFVDARVKYKTEKYFEAIRVINHTKDIDMSELAIEKGISTWEEMSTYLLDTYLTDIDKEEVLYILKGKWEEIYPKLSKAYSTSNILMSSALLAARKEERKERYLFLVDTVGKEYASVVMDVVDGKNPKNLIRHILRKI